MSRADYLERFPSHAAATEFEQDALAVADDTGLDVPERDTPAYWTWLIGERDSIAQQEREYAAKVQR